MTSDGQLAFVLILVSLLVALISVAITSGYYDSNHVKVHTWEEKTVVWQEKSIRVPVWVTSKGRYYKCELGEVKE